MRIGFSLVGAQQRILSSLAAANAAAALSTLRLATGQRYARPSDGPAASRCWVPRYFSAVRRENGKVEEATLAAGP